MSMGLRIVYTPAYTRQLKPNDVAGKEI